MNIASHPRLLALLSAAYAVGTLRAGARRRFEALAREQPAVRASALLWQERLSAFVELAPAVEPSPVVWTRIRNLVEAEQASARAAAVAATAKKSPAWGESWWGSLALWRGAAAFGLCAAVVLGILNGEGRQDEPGSAMQYVSVLTDDHAKPSMLVTFDPRSGQLTMQRVGEYREAADHSLQLWALPSGGAPQSLGVLPSAGQGMRLVADAGAVQQSPTLAITLEQKGGVSGANGPGGPVLFKGALIKKTL